MTNLFIGSPLCDALQGLWNYDRLFNILYGQHDRDQNKTRILEWLKDAQLLPETRNCPTCRRRMQLENSSRESDPLNQDTCLGLRFRCNNRSHPRLSRTLAQNTIFERNNMRLDKVIRLIYHFAMKDNYDRVCRELFNGEKGTSRESISDMFSYLREVCMIALDHSFDSAKLGGPGHVVEIDEMKIGRRKYNVGRVVEGNWVLGLIDVCPDGCGCETRGQLRLEICPNNSRNAPTLEALILKHVEPGTTIMTDGWAAYWGLERLGYNHLDVNHSENFVDPTTWATTNKIESQWRSLRRRLSRGGVTAGNLADHLCEYLFFQECQRKPEYVDPFGELLKWVAFTYPGVGQRR